MTTKMTPKQTDQIALLDAELDEISKASEGDLLNGNTAPELPIIEIDPAFISDLNKLQTGGSLFSSIVADKIETLKDRLNFRNKQLSDQLPTQDYITVVVRRAYNDMEDTFSELITSFDSHVSQATPKGGYSGNPESDRMLQRLINVCGLKPVAEMSSSQAKQALLLPDFVITSLSLDVLDLQEISNPSRHRTRTQALAYLDILHPAYQYVADKAIHYEFEHNWTPEYEPAPIDLNAGKAPFARTTDEDVSL